MLHTRIQDYGEHDHIHGINLADKDRMRLGQTEGISSSNFWCSDQQVQLRATQQDEDNTIGSDDSGFCSPPLWKNSPSPQRSSTSSQPLLSHHAYTTTLSPNSRLQAITRGQKELMEMVRNLPESLYELSLKDLVEHHQMETQASTLGEVLGGSNRQSGGALQQQRREGAIRIKRQGSKAVRRSGSFEIENSVTFLKMGLPFSLQRKKRNKFAGNGSGKVSPKPEGIKAHSAGERDWWKKKFTGSSDSDSSRTSNNSGSSGRSGSTGSITNDHSNDSSRKKNRRTLSSCGTIFQFRRSIYED